MFNKLREREIITNEMEEKLKEMKAFCNTLVHRYDHIDDKLVYENLNNLGDFLEFKHQITAFFENNYYG
ncbi:MAG: DUF86 domain-containing protein [Candidatus Korarchaeota archaeon]|nr:DUF86 domain-containing protein [Candidatus Korarchaeota archaeon]